MARIPTYRSQVAAEVGTRLDLPRVDASHFGGQVGHGLQRMGQAIAAREEKEQRESENAQRLAKLNDFVGLRTATAADRQEARRNMAPDGAEHREGLLKRFDERAAAFMGGVTSPKLQAEYQARVAELRADLDLDEGAYVVGVQAHKAASDFDTAVSTAANDLAIAGSERGLAQSVALFRENLAAIPQLNAEQKSKLEKLATNRLSRSFIEGLAERDPYKAREILRSGKLNSLIDADNMTGITNRVDSEIRGREAQARAEEAARRAEARAAAAAAREAERDRREAARDYVGGISAALSAGVPVPMDTVRQAARMAGSLGNPGQSVAIAVLGTKAAVNQQFGRMSPVELQFNEQALSAQIAKDGANADPTAIAARDQLRDLRQAQRKAASEDLLGWEAQYGQQIPTLDGNDPDSFRRRGAIATSAARRYGVKPSPLTSTEADAFTLQLTTGTPQQKMVAVSQLSQFGPYTKDAARQVAAKDPVAGWAIGLAGQGRLAATQDLFQGADYLKAQPKLAPKDKVDERFTALIGPAFRFMPGASGPAKAAATQIYAARWGRSGGADWRAPAFDAGVRMALGAVRGADGVERGGLGEWRGVPVVLGAGVSQEDFDGSMARLTDERLKAAAGLRPVDDRGRDVSAETIRGGALYSAGDGRYYVVLPGASTPLRRPDGKLFALRIGGAQ
jgi:hypothetical protein